MTKIFGIGLNKTGTTTLGECLSALGYRHMSCRPDLLARYRKGLSEAVFAEIDKAESFEDWPYPLMYRELAARYPDARFILTVRRSTETWLASMKKHSLLTSVRGHCRELAYGRAYPFGNEDHYRGFYEDHNRQVRKFFARPGAPPLLELCWERGDGWPELCAFLGHEVPAVALPHANPAREPTAPRDVAKKYLNMLNARLGIVPARF